MKMMNDMPKRGDRVVSFKQEGRHVIITFASGKRVWVYQGSDEKAKEIAEYLSPKIGDISDLT